jgi:lysophospholipase L1-like esterase
VSRPPRLGVLAFGDSITNGGGELQYGVALQSWALWLARGLGLPYTGFAVDGARAADVAQHQLAAFAATTAQPDAAYDVGCLYVGVNDVRAPDWAPTAFARDHETALTFLAARCERTLCVTLPERLGRPATPHARIEAANAAIEAAAAAHGALVLDLRGFGARNRVMADRVHPTALGQVAIAEAALARLAADGLPSRARPQAMIAPSAPTPAQRLRGDLTYVRRALRAQAGR